MFVTEIMTEAPQTIRPDETITEAAIVLQSLGIRHLPVVDDRGQLVGMLSDRDLAPVMRTFLELAEADNMVVPLSGRAVSELMSGGVISVDGDAPVSDVVELMLENGIGAVPVVDGDGSLIGIVSYVDVLRALTASPEEPSLRDGRRGRRASDQASR
jgi:CBS domain-containing protein